MYQIPADVAMTVRTTAAAGRRLLLMHDAVDRMLDWITT
jgi:hypothetical protein